MHWYAYPLRTPSLIQGRTKQQTQRNSKKKSTSTAQSSATCCENSRRDWQLSKWLQKTSSKKVYIVPSLKRECFTDTEAQMDINGT